MPHPPLLPGVFCFQRRVAAEVAQLQVKCPNSSDGCAQILARSDVDSHLQRLVLRFHSRDLAADSPDLAQWRFMVESLEFLDQSRDQTWAAVCVALFTHPDFYSY